MAKIINFSDHFRREQSENKLRRIKQQLNSALGLNLSDDSIRYLMTEPGVNMKDPKTKSPEQLTLFDFLPTDKDCLLYTSPSPRDGQISRMPSSA